MLPRSELRGQQRQSWELPGARRPGGALGQRLAGERTQTPSALAWVRTSPLQTPPKTKTKTNKKTLPSLDFLVSPCRNPWVATLINDLHINLRLGVGFWGP